MGSQHNRFRDSAATPGPLTPAHVPFLDEDTPPPTGSTPVPKRPAADGLRPVDGARDGHSLPCAPGPATGPLTIPDKLADAVTASPAAGKKDPPPPAAGTQPARPVASPTDPRHITATGITRADLPAIAGNSQAQRDRAVVGPPDSGPRHTPAPQTPPAAADAATPDSARRQAAAAAHLAAHGIGPDGKKTAPRPGENIVTLPRKILAGFLSLAFIVTVIGVIMIWPGDTEPTIRPEFTQNSAMSHQVAAGTVIITDDGPCNSPSVGRVFDSAPATPVQPSDNTCTQAIIEITSGPDEGRRTMLLLAGTPGDPTLAQGDAITLQLTTTSDGTNGYSFLDYQRTVPLAWWVIVTLVAVVAVGGFVGFRSIIGLLVTLAVVGFVLLPGLLRGGDPLILATVCGSAALFLALYLVHGVTWKTSSALAGTLIALFLATWLARIGIEGIRLRGLGSEDNLLIQLYLPDVTVQGLMLAGFIIGSLGVLNDVTISQASTVNELAHLDPKATPLRLFTGAIRVGRDHIASIMYTLVLGYTGAAIPLLLLLSAADRPLGQVLTSDIMATEILRSAVGALALTLAVPITTLIAAFTAVTGPGDSHDHSHGHS